MLKHDFVAMYQRRLMTIQWLSGIALFGWIAVCLFSKFALNSPIDASLMNDGSAERRFLNLLDATKGLFRAAKRAPVSIDDLDDDLLLAIYFALDIPSILALRQVRQQPHDFRLPLTMKSVLVDERKVLRIVERVLCVVAHIQDPSRVHQASSRAPNHVLHVERAREAGNKGHKVRSELEKRNAKACITPRVLIQGEAPYPPSRGQMAPSA